MRMSIVAGNRLELCRFRLTLAHSVLRDLFAAFCATAVLFAGSARSRKISAVQASARTRAASRDTLREADFLWIDALLGRAHENRLGGAQGAGGSGLVAGGQRLLDLAHVALSAARASGLVDLGALDHLASGFLGR